MKKVSIINIKTNQSFGAELEDPTEWINDCIVNNYWGKPERWVITDSEPYEPSDIIQTEERISEITGESSSWVLLRTEYTIEIIDLDEDYDWLLSECHKKRQSEYPPISELGDALYWKEQGNDSKYIEYINKCDIVKKKYLLPIKKEVV